MAVLLLGLWVDSNHATLVILVLLDQHLASKKKVCAKKNNG